MSPKLPHDRKGEDRPVSGDELDLQDQLSRHACSALTAWRVSVFSIDLDWRLRMVEGAAVRVVGSEPSALLGRDARELFGRHTNVVTDIGRALSGEEFTTVGDFGGVPFEVRFSRWLDDDGQLVGTTGVAIDVAERERAIRTLREGEERFRALAESSGEFVAVLDDSGLFTYVSPEYQAKLGYEASALIGRPSVELLHPEELEAGSHQLQFAIEEDAGPEAVRFRVRHRDGSWLWLAGSASTFQDSAGRTQILAVCHDETRQVELEARLRSQIDLEREISELSSYFLELDSDSVDDALRAKMEAAAAVAGADRTTLLLATPDAREPYCRYDWSNQPRDAHRGRASDPSAIQHFRHAQAILADGSPFHVPSLDALPAEAEAERVDMLERGVQSRLVLPLRLRSRVVGYHIYECLDAARRWSDEEITLLALLGEVFARAFERQRTDATLRASEARFRALTENMGDLVLELDSQGCIDWVNPSFLSALDMRLEELRGRELASIVHPADEQLVRGRLTEAYRSGATVATVFRVQHVTGRWLWVEGTGRAFHSSAGELRYVGMARDVTEQKALLESLERQHQADLQISTLSRLFLALAPDEIDAGIQASIDDIVRLAGADRGFMVGVEGATAIRVASQGWTEAELAAATGGASDGGKRRYQWATDLLHGGQVLHIPDCAQLAGLGLAEGKDLVDRGVGSLLGIPVCLEDTLVGYLGFERLGSPCEWSAREISEMQMVAGILASAMRRKKAELALAEQLELERRISELSKRFLDLAPGELEGAIVGALAEAADLAGADRACLVSFDEEVVRAQRGGEDRADVFAWSASRDGEAEPCAPVWRDARIAAGGVIHFPSASGSRVEDEIERALAASGVRSALGIPISSDQGIVGSIAFECLVDKREWGRETVTLLRLVGELFGSALRRLRVENALRESQTQLLHAQKMDAVGRLAGGIAHDFNNLLTVILGFSRAILREADSESPFHDDVEQINAAAERAATLTRQLLTFSRRQPSLPSQVDLNEVVGGVEELLGHLLGARVDLRLELAGGLCGVNCDGSQLEQVLVNLAVNARDAMPDGGRIVIRTRSCTLTAADCRRVGIEEPGDYEMIEVVDEGVGMPAEVLEHIFEPFYTTKAPGKGTGLGLSIVYSVARDHGGGIAVETERDCGTTFRVYLPTSRHVEADVDEVGPGRPAVGCETILIVDDEDAVRRLVSRIARAAGYSVLEAAGGTEALDVAERSSWDSIDLLVTDVVMPGMSGGQLALQLRARRPGLPVLYVSGYPRDQARGAAPEMPPGHLLVKPFSENGLLGEIRSALDSVQDDEA